MPDLSSKQKAVARLMDDCVFEAIRQGLDEGRLRKIPVSEALEAIVAVLAQRLGSTSAMLEREANGVTINRDQIVLMIMEGHNAFVAGGPDHTGLLQ